MALPRDSNEDEDKSDNDDGRGDGRPRGDEEEMKAKGSPSSSVGGVRRFLPEGSRWRALAEVRGDAETSGLMTVFEVFEVHAELGRVRRSGASEEDEVGGRVGVGGGDKCLLPSL